VFAKTICFFCAFLFLFISSFFFLVYFASAAAAAAAAADTRCLRDFSFTVLLRVEGNLRTGRALCGGTRAYDLRALPRRICLILLLYIIIIIIITCDTREDLKDGREPRDP